MLGRLGGLVGHHPWVTVVTWLLLAASGFALANGLFGNESLFDRLVSGNPEVPGEAQTALELLDEASESGPAVTGLLDELDPADPDLAALVTTAAEDLADVEGVQAVLHPYAFGPEDPRGQAYVSVGGDAVAVVVVPEQDAPDTTSEAVVDRLDTLVADVADEVPGARGEVGGIDQVVEAITGQVEEDLQGGELVALPSRWP